MLSKKQSSETPYIPFSKKIKNDPYSRPIPDPRYRLQKGVNLSLGDGHANIIALLFSLLYHSVYELDAHSWDTLVYYVNLPIEHITKGHHAIIAKTFHQLQFIKKAREGHIRFLGDNTGDRRHCDLWMLYLLKALHQNSIAYTICISNHDMEFIHYMETGMQEPGFFMRQRKEFIHSLLALHTLLQKGIVKQDFVLYLYKTYYRPYLQILSYSITPDNRMSFFSHAYGGIYLLERLSIDFKIPLSPDIFPSTTTKVKQIQKVQEQFSMLRDQGLLHQHVHIHPTEPRSIFFDKNWNGIGLAIWNRVTQPAMQGWNTKDWYINGHDKTKHLPANVLSLDNAFGKSAYYGRFNAQWHNYRFRYDHESSTSGFHFFQQALNEIEEEMLSFIPILLQEDEINALLDPNRVHSSYHIKILHFFLCKPQSESYWKQFLHTNILYSEFLSTLCYQISLLEIVYLLHTLQLLCEETLIALAKRLPEEQEVFSSLYSCLLILQSSPTLCHLSNVLLILSYEKALVGDFYRALVQGKAASLLTQGYFNKLVPVEQSLQHMILYSYVMNLIRLHYPLEYPKAHAEAFSFRYCSWLSQQFTTHVRGFFFYENTIMDFLARILLEGMYHATYFHKKEPVYLIIMQKLSDTVLTLYTENRQYYQIHDLLNLLESANANKPLSLALLDYISQGQAQIRHILIAKPALLQEELFRYYFQEEKMVILSPLFSILEQYHLLSFANLEAVAKLDRAGKWTQQDISFIGQYLQNSTHSNRQDCFEKCINHLIAKTNNSQKERYPSLFFPSLRAKEEREYSINISTFS